MLFITQKKKGYKKGFSLIEAVVAIAILLVAITGTLTSASQGILFAAHSRDQFIASYLAIEAIEYVKSVRAENRFNSNPWLSGLSDCIDQYCMLNPYVGSFSAFDEAETCLTPADPSSCLKLSIFDVPGSPRPFVYGHSNLDTAFPGATLIEESLYKRSVRITENIVGQEALIEVRIEWNRRSTPQEYITQTYLLNWF